MWPAIFPQIVLEPVYWELPFQALTVVVNEMTAQELQLSGEKFHPIKLGIRKNRLFTQSLSTH